MISLPEDEFLKFNPDTLMYIRKQYNFDKPGAIEQAVDLLDDWIKKQNHFTKKDYLRGYLERSIILHKGSVERAKLHIESLCTLRKVLPKYFEKHSATDDHKDLNDDFKQAVLPMLTKHHYRVYIGKAAPTASNPKRIFESYTFYTIMLEYMLTHDYCDGFILVLDYRDINFLDLIAAINFIEFKEFVTILMKGYALRIKSIHILTLSKGTEIFWNTLKKIVGTKIGNRIYLHSKIETLHDHLPKHILPEEFGGSEKSLNALSQEMIEVLSTKQHVEYTKEISRAVVDDSYKISHKFKDMEMAGTFRSLNVD